MIIYIHIFKVHLFIKHCIVGLKLRNVIILGDFNTYNDFESPIDMMTLTQKPEQTMTGCNLEQRNIGNRFTRFDDAWQKLHGNKDLGLTFSNMVIDFIDNCLDSFL